MKKVYKVAVLILSVLMISSVHINGIYAQENDDIQYLKQELRKYDVPEDKIEGLIEKYEQGILWDSLSDTNFSEVEPETSIMIGDLSYQVYRYPDGSVRVSQISGGVVEEGTIESRSISGGTVSSGSGNWWSVRGATASDNYITITASFKLDYNGHPTLKAQITRVYDSYIAVVGGSYSIETFGITNDGLNGNPAVARLSFQYSTSLASSTKFMEAVIFSRKTMYTRHNFKGGY